MVLGFRELMLHCPQRYGNKSNTALIRTLVIAYVPKSSPDQQPILITFDDNIANALAATSILQARGLRAVMYTVTVSLSLSLSLSLSHSLSLYPLLFF